MATLSSSGVEMRLRGVGSLKNSQAPISELHIGQGTPRHKANGQTPTVTIHDLAACRTATRASDDCISSDTTHSQPYKSKQNSSVTDTPLLSEWPPVFV